MNLEFRLWSIIQSDNFIVFQFANQVEPVFTTMSSRNWSSNMVNHDIRAYFLLFLLFVRLTSSAILRWKSTPFSNFHNDEIKCKMTQEEIAMKQLNAIFLSNSLRDALDIKIKVGTFCFSPEAPTGWRPA